MCRTLAVSWDDYVVNNADESSRCRSEALSLAMLTSTARSKVSATSGSEMKFEPEGIFTYTLLLKVVRLSTGLGKETGLKSPGKTSWIAMMTVSVSYEV